MIHVSFNKELNHELHAILKENILPFLLCTVSTFVIRPRDTNLLQRSKRPYDKQTVANNEHNEHERESVKDARCNEHMDQRECNYRAADPPSQHRIEHQAFQVESEKQVPDANLSYFETINNQR